MSQIITLSPDDNILGTTRASARAAAIAKKREAKHLSGMESPENIRGQTADEHVVRSRPRDAAREGE